MRATWGKPLLHEGLDPAAELLLTDIVTEFGEDVLLEGVKPALDDVPERPIPAGGRGETFEKSTVNGFQTVQGRFGLGDLYLRGGETLPFRALLHPARVERLSASVFAPDGFELASATFHFGELVVEGLRDPVQAHGELVQPLAGDGAPAEGVDDVSSFFGTDAHDNSNCSRNRFSFRRTVLEARSNSRAA